MQLMYLIPAAVMMWRTFDNGAGLAGLLVPVLVMGAGQLAGGLAWLSISGEDAPDLIASAPVPATRATRAKVEIVLLVISGVFAPLLLPLAIAWWPAAVVAAIGIAIAAASAIAVQLWFRLQARRSQFRRRHVSSRIATFAEAFASIGWAATAGLVIASPAIAILTAVMTSGVLGLAWAISPKRA
jgi:ABC-2 type transport system permease protein